MNDQLATYIRKYITISDQELEVFFKALSKKSYDKKAFILREGETCAHYYFITKGMVRQYTIDEDRHERILQFGIENWWITNMESFIHQEPSRTFIQCIEATEVWCVEKSSLDRLYIEVPVLERFFRIILEKTFIALQKRNSYYLRMSGTDRYQVLAKNLPQLVQRIPQYMIASYLDLTPEYLSSIRSKQ